jgi:hypothetical protein
MAVYPDWVMKHKKKGTYINFVNGKYYLYKAHSERVPGTKKVRRVFDGYLGRITEEDGLIPVRDKVTDEVVVFEYGLCMTLLGLCGDISKGFAREFRAAADRIFVAGLLLAIYKDCSQEIYEWSYLSIKFPGFDMTKTLTDKQRVGAERCMRMESDVMLKHFGEDKDAAVSMLSRIYMVKINNQFYCSKISENTKEFLLKYKLEWSYSYGKESKD